MSLAHYPAFSTPTEEEKNLPELTVSIRIIDSHVRFAVDQNPVANLPPAIQARVTQMLGQFERDFATWFSLSHKQPAQTLPAGVVLAARSRALDVDTKGTALASRDDRVVYLSYALMREGVPVGFRLGVFAYVFDCLARNGNDRNCDELLDELSLPLLKDQVNVLGAPERYAMFANKDWLDALFAHLAQMLPRLDVQATSLDTLETPSREPDTELSEEQRQRVAELAARNRMDQAILLKKMRTLVTIISTGLGEDVDISVVPGEWWAFDYERNAITFPLVELVTAPPDKIIGYLLHEIGHYQVTRVDVKHPVFKRLLSSESLRLLLNTFEDPRASNWMKATFKGTSPYLDLIYDDLLSEDLSATAYSHKLQKEVQKYSDSAIQEYQLFPHLEYLLCVLYFWRFDRLPSHVISPQVAAALERTVQFFPSIFNHYPLGRAAEYDKLRYAREAAELIQDYILEPYEQLLKQAANNLTLGMERGQHPLGEGENPSEINPQLLEREAQEILEEQAKELADRLSAKRNVPESVDADVLRTKNWGEEG